MKLGTALTQCSLCRNFQHCTAAGYCNCGAYGALEGISDQFEREFSDEIILARRILAAVPDNYTEAQLRDIGGRARHWVMKAYYEWRPATETQPTAPCAAAQPDREREAE